MHVSLLQQNISLKSLLFSLIVDRKYLTSLVCSQLYIRQPVSFILNYKSGLKDVIFSASLIIAKVCSK